MKKVAIGLGLIAVAALVGFGAVSALKGTAEPVQEDIVLTAGSETPDCCADKENVAMSDAAVHAALTTAEAGSCPVSKQAAGGCPMTAQASVAEAGCCGDQAQVESVASTAEEMNCANCDDPSKCQTCEGELTASTVDVNQEKM